MHGSIRTRPRTRRRLTVAGLAVVLSAALLIGRAPGASAARSDGWSIDQSPRIRGGGWLEATAAISADDVWAVGTTVSDGPLAEHWDGTSWNRVPTHVSG